MLEVKDIYTLAIMKYEEDNNDLTEEFLYPKDWDNSLDYILKANILAEAIDKHILIQDTELYNSSFKHGCEINEE